MDIEQFREEGHRLVDWLAEYFINIRDLPVKSSSAPGSIYNALPEKAPENNENFDHIWADFQSIILPGITHWQHPHFHAYFPANTSYPSILAEILVAGLAPQCMIWETSPAAAELEEKVMDWLKNALPLGKNWHGVIQDTASTATLTALLTARERASGFKSNLDGVEQNNWRVYCSKETHSSIDKAMRISGLGSNNLVKISTGIHQNIDPKALLTHIKSDINKGYKPLMVVAAIGTTGTLATDHLGQINKITSKYKLWLHVDAAYAGIGCLLPEYQHLLSGAEMADSIVVNAHKWMFTNFDCSLYFVKDKHALINTFSILPEYLRTSTQGLVNDYRDWGIQLGRRFRALKLWFVLRSMGLHHIRHVLRQQIKWTHWLEHELRTLKNIEIMVPARLNMLCFRWLPQNPNASIEAVNAFNMAKLQQLNAEGKLYLSHTKIEGKTAMRMVLGQTYLTSNDVRAIPALLGK